MHFVHGDTHVLAIVLRRSMAHVSDNRNKHPLI
ncbi:hypothetical protein GGQ68_001774 [Sagittula marina]|uniref:Uncharacterized protein n=1 Tax=Sagittula marina TaxID=943940 RepID=A0A7W6GRK0_9RHOB|nr:hypothetical protein [Sagittula marina]